MSRRRGPTPPRPWGPWKHQGRVQERKTTAKGSEDALPGDVYENGRYVVLIREMEPEHGRAGWLQLSIRPRNRRPVRDWRQFQRIKNELAGEEREAVELFPAESRLVDTSNQYHLWVLPDGEQVGLGV